MGIVECFVAPVGIVECEAAGARFADAEEWSEDHARPRDPAKCVLKSGCTAFFARMGVPPPRCVGVALFASLATCLSKARLQLRLLAGPRD